MNMKMNSTDIKAIAVTTEFLRDDRLSLSTKAACLIMKTYGRRSFTRDEVSRILGAEKPDLELMLAELCRAGYLRETERYADTEDDLFMLED